MDKRIMKTALVILIGAIWSLILPIFGQWYEQQTGIQPIGFYFIGAFGGFGMAVVSILKTWGEIK